jgi:hypothetical protein
MANQFKESEFGGGYGSTGVDVDANGDISMDGNLIVGGTLTAGGANAILGTVGATTNRLVRSDGTGTKTVKSTGITVDDSNNVSGVGTLGCGAITSSGALAITGALTGATTGAFSSTLTATGNVTVGGDTGNKEVNISGGSALNSFMRTKEAGVNAFTFGFLGATQKGVIRRYNSGGTLQDDSLSIDRATGEITLAGQLTTPGISASGGTGATGALADRTYTPTTAASTNCDSVTWGLWRWHRIGQRIMTSGLVTIVPTAASAATVNFNPPVASDFTNSNQAAGHGNAVTATPTAQPTILADATNDNLQMFLIPASTSSQIYYCSVMYDRV